MIRAVGVPVAHHRSAERPAIPGAESETAWSSAVKSPSFGGGSRSSS